MKRSLDKIASSCLDFCLPFAYTLTPTLVDLFPGWRPSTEKAGALLPPPESLQVGGQQHVTRWNGTISVLS